MKVKLTEKKIIVGLDGKERAFYIWEDGFISYNMWKNNKDFGATHGIKNDKFPKHTTKEMLLGGIEMLKIGQLVYSDFMGVCGQITGYSSEGGRYSIKDINGYVWHLEKRDLAVLNND